MLLRGADDTTLVAAMLHDNISAESVKNACAIVRTRERTERTELRCERHDPSTVNGIAYCTKCNASESEIMDDMVSDADMKMDLAVSSERQPATQQNSARFGPAHALRQDIRPNDQPLFPSYTIDVTTGLARVRARVSMHGVVNIRTVSRDVPRLLVDININDEGAPSKQRVTFSMLLDDPCTINANRYACDAHKAHAQDALVFDRAVRIGEDAAVGAYGLILFALAVRTEHEQKHARASVDQANVAMDAVMTTVERMTEETKL